MRALSAQGFTNVEFTGYSWFACGKEDQMHTGFIATGRDGKRIEGAVCCGLIFKNCTIRTE